MCRKKSQARNAIENGLTTQFTNKVTSKPRGLCPTRRIDAKSTFIIMGTIMSQISTAMGKFTWLPCPNSMRRNDETRSGIHLPAAIPATMHRPTHTVRYLSKKASRFGFGTPAWLQTTVLMRVYL